MQQQRHIKRVYMPPARKAGARHILLSSAIEGFLLACEGRKLSLNTIDDYSRTMRRFLEHVGDVSLNSISTSHISAFLASFKEHSAKTVLNFHIGLAALWTWAMREGYANVHVVRLTERPRPQQRVISPLTELNIKTLLSHCDGKNEIRNRCIIMLLLDTGMRASELCGIDERDIDLLSRKIKVMGKGNKERFIPFSKRTAETLFSYLSQDTRPKHKIFPLQRTSLDQLLKRLGKKADVRGVHPHKFRHTFAIQYLRNGGDVYTLQSILGHSTLDMVRHYLALAQVDIDATHQRCSPVENWQL